MLSTPRWVSRSSGRSRPAAARHRSITAPTASSSAKGRGCSSSSGWTTRSDRTIAIYGIIAGIGLSNDVHGDLMAPDSEGQLRAMRAAYEQAGWSPGDVDLIECHATGTPRGDAVEIASLRALWGDDRLECRPVRDRLDQGEHRPCAHRGRRGRTAQGPVGPEAPYIASDGEFRAGRARSRAREEPVPRREPPRALAGPRVRTAPPRRHQRFWLRRDQRPCPDRGVACPLGPVETDRRDTPFRRSGDRATAPDPPSPSWASRHRSDRC